MMRTLGIALITAAAAFHQLAAQWPPSVTAGARVQVRLPEVQYQLGGTRGHLIRGRVTALTPDTLYLAITDSLAPIPVPRRLIERLQYSRGVPSRLESGLRRGLITGAAYALVLAAWNELDNDPGGSSTGTAALVGGGLGLVTGGIFGAIFPIERWKRVRLEPEVSRTP
jgi:hypothetical protein